jgi:hypothetical protein
MKEGENPNATGYQHTVKICSTRRVLRLPQTKFEEKHDKTLEMMMAYNLVNILITSRSDKFIKCHQFLDLSTLIRACDLPHA